MQKSTLIEIVRSLDRKEVREVSKWLQSPAHNQRQDVIIMFDYLCKKLPKSDESLQKERVWAAVFPGKPMDDAYLRQVMYFLLKAIEAYMAYTEFMSDDVQVQIALMRIYRKRKLEKAYKQAHRLGAENLANQPLRNAYYLLSRFFLEQEEYEHRMTITQNAPVNLQEMATALEKWFIEARLRISRDMLAHRHMYQKITYEHGLLQQTLEYAQTEQMMQEPAVAVYYYTYMALTNPSEESYFDELEEKIHNDAHYFDHSEVRTLYLAALNYCVPKINHQGRMDFARRAFDLYRKGLENGILLENQLVSRYTFGNAVGAALKIREFDWAEQFVRDFQHYLEEKDRNSIVNFNLSRIYFEKNDYDKAQQLLLQFDYNEMGFNIIAKTMLLKIYYEQSEFDAFESLLESLRIYILRKEALDPTRKHAFKNMISLMKKLMNVNTHSKLQRERLRTLVQGTQPLMERDWLLRQLE